MILNSRVLRLALASLTVLSAAAAMSQPGNSQPARPFAQSQSIPGQYIVVFKDSVGNAPAEAANLARGAGGQLLHSYSWAIKGFAATLPAAAVQGILNNPNVDYVEQDQTVSLSQAQSPATWGLDRIDQVDRPLDTIYHYNYTGAGVKAYIVDTGIRADHLEFTGRLLSGFSAISDGRGTSDCNGHGTHVAGTVGGTTWGVAKQANLIPVRVLDCKGSGTWSGVIAGIDWVANNGGSGSVANMSLGGGFSSSINAAVAGAVAQGVTMVVAAGNSNANACSYSPSSEPSAITVGATTSADARASYSNYGTCLDLFAPGSSITSAWYTSNTASNIISGTSMASPHVAGVAALAIQANPGSTPAAIAQLLVSNATLNHVGSAGTGSPNKLLFSMATTGAVEPALLEIAVQSITGSSARNGRNWRAHVNVTIRNLGTGGPVANATVSGSFSPGGTASCVTASSGSCTMTSGAIAASYAFTSFTVTNVSGTNMSYLPGQNSMTQINIAKP